jgi:AraC-like DNA-binding protein
MTKIDGSKKIALDEYRITILTDDLNDYFLTHPYLNNELTLSDVALATGYTRNQISYVLNRSFGKSFYDYINYARINYLLEQLILSYKGNINFLADQAGFNSITTFYKFFKQKTGQTPKAYINNMMK